MAAVVCEQLWVVGQHLQSLFIHLQTSRSADKWFCKTHTWDCKNTILKNLLSQWKQNLQQVFKGIQTNYICYIKRNCLKMCTMYCTTHAMCLTQKMKTLKNLLKLWQHTMGQIVKQKGGKRWYNDGKNAKKWRQTAWQLVPERLYSSSALAPVHSWNNCKETISA